MSPIERGCDFLAGDRWKREQHKVTAGHGGRDMADGIGVDNYILRYTRALSFVRQPQSRAWMNNSGWYTESLGFARCAEGRAC